MLVHLDLEISLGHKLKMSEIVPERPVSCAIKKDQEKGDNMVAIGPLYFGRKWRVQVQSGRRSISCGWHENYWMLLS